MSIKIEKHPNSGPSKGKAGIRGTSWKWAKVFLSPRKQTGASQHSGQHDAPPQEIREPYRQRQMPRLRTA